MCYSDSEQPVPSFLQGKTPLVFSHGKWLKAVLHHHTSHIMSSPECEEILTSMNTIIEARTRNYNKILQLRGKLEMIVKQVNTQDEQGEFKLKLINYNLLQLFILIGVLIVPMY